MGERVAHLVTGRLIDFLEFDDGFAIAKTHAPVLTHHEPADLLIVSGPTCKIELFASATKVRK